jgi:hypothetical protein
MEPDDKVARGAFTARAALISGTIRGAYMRRRDRKTFSYTLTWASRAAVLTWSAIVEGRDNAGFSRTSGTHDVAPGITPPELEQMARSAAHAAIEKGAEGPRGRLAVLRAALRRVSAPEGPLKP